MTWPVFVINMADNTTRMDRVASELAQLGIDFTRFEGVDGRALSQEKIAQVYDPVANLRRSRHPMVKPEIGCYLSHIALWEKIAAGDAPGGFILEDDFAATDDLAEALAAIASDDADWDIAKLFSARVKQKIFAPRPLIAGHKIGAPYKVPNTMLGYAIRRSAAAYLAASALPMSRPVDEDHKHFWESKIRVVMVTPPVLAFGEQSAETGTITAARHRTQNRNVRTLLFQGWRSLRFRLNYIIKLHWNRMIGRVR